MQTQILQPKRTRAEVFRDKVKIRLAANDAGLEIERIVKENGVELPPTDWSQVFPHWLIATIEDEVIGCVMVLPAKPFGFIEFLLVKPTVSMKFRAIAIKKLCYQALATLSVYGSSLAFSAVDADNRKFADIMKKHGMVKVTDGDLMVKRLK